VFFSAAVLNLDIVKVFLLDPAGVQGIFRTLSFIGLGSVLTGIVGSASACHLRGARRPDASLQVVRNRLPSRFAPVCLRASPLDFLYRRLLCLWELYD